MGPADLAAFNKVVFNGLKPGGRYVVIDHSAKDGSGISATEPLHRIDGAVVMRDVIAAGFVLDAERDMLRNPADPRDKVVWDPSIQGKTDQFVYVFRKPG